MSVYIIHYGELALKGGNRPQFEKQLSYNIRAALRDLGTAATQRFYGYIVLTMPDDIPQAEVESRLARVFGIAYFAPATVVPAEFEAIAEAALRLAQGVITAETTFKVHARRGDKQFPYTSPEINREIGARIVDLTHAPVKMHQPDVTLNIQVYRDAAYLFIKRLPGAGGLPVGVSGRVLSLFSGGIDSPVASMMMQRRGCTLQFLHFHLLPPDAARNSKIVSLARAVLAVTRFSAPLYLASAAPFEAAMATVNTRLATVLFRRLMMRVASRLAERNRCLALVTGDSVGQVASQTLPNMGVIERATEWPILRPLVGMDKEEIIKLARHYGTYELSIQEYRDPCSLHANRPATHARLSQVLELESQLDMDALVEETLATVDELWIEFA